MKNFTVHDEATFKLMLRLERKRSQRTAADFLLVLLNIEKLQRHHNARVVEDVGSALRAAIRDTDALGWYHTNSSLGLICTAFNGAARNAVQAAVAKRIRDA